MSRFFSLVLHLTLFLYQRRAAARHDLHTFLSNDELRRYLHTDSHESVPEYDVVRIYKHRGKRSPFSTKQDYRLSAFGKDFALTLQQNDDVIPDTGLPIKRRKRDGMVVKEIHRPHGIFYEGHVTSDPNSHVAVRETDDKGQLSGALVSGGHLYHLEPLSSHLHRRAALQGSEYHVISKRSIRDMLNQNLMSTHNKGKTQEQEEIQVDQTETPKSRTTRDNIYNGNIYIEAMLTADKTTCDFYGNGTLDYLLNIANLVNRLYKDKSIGMPVSWVLTKVFLIEGFDPDLDFAANNIRSAGSYHGKFKNWAFDRNPANGKQEHYDIAAMLTRNVCGLNSCSINGVANMGLCGKYPGVSINVAIGLSAAYTVTHEVAHNIGVGHDNGSCHEIGTIIHRHQADLYEKRSVFTRYSVPWIDSVFISHSIGVGHDNGDCHRMGAIMHRQQAHGPNAFHWSPCSMKKLKERFTLHKCLHNQPPAQLPLPSLPPLFSADEQCQMAYGKDYTACGPTLRESCGALFCEGKGGSCFTRSSPVAEGTLCGIRKICLAGHCRHEPRVPGPIDGGWGSWGSYEACTRTCGGGVRYRSRQCNNPVPKFYGKACEGSSKGHFEMCNTQECSVDRFRHQQCEAHNTDSKKYRPHFLGGSSKCTLACVTGGRGYYFGDVTDGTRCEGNKNVFDVCIEGKCVPVGCDKKLRSGKVFDRCLNCGGDGGSCVLVGGMYTKDYRVYGRNNGDIMFTIPKGATNVQIQEMNKSYNFLSIKSTKAVKAVDYYVPVPSWTNTYAAAGTFIYHYMKKYQYIDAERITIRGPTNENLDAMYVHPGRHGNPGISYSYYIPGNGKSTTFKWNQTINGECSTTCAGGVQHIKVTCHREDDASEVSSDYCDKNTKTAESKLCNLAPCPKEYKLGAWSQCSELCGGGQQHRNLTCAQVMTQKYIKILPDSSCTNLSKPESYKPCNNIDCMPQWVTGEWTQCSVPCGGNGTKTRLVECKRKLANGSWLALPEDHCTEKPSSQTSCNNVPCYKWQVQYPCVSCGGSDMSYFPIGCFMDKHIGERPLEKLVANFRNGIDWHHMSKTVKKCAEDALSKHYDVFGVQFYGECWSGDEGYKTYDKDGFNLQGCWEGVGKSNNNYVYAFTSMVSQPRVDCIYVANGQIVPDEKCSASKPLAKMKRCSDVCRN